MMSRFLPRTTEDANMVGPNSRMMSRWDDDEIPPLVSGPAQRPPDLAIYDNILIASPSKDPRLELLTATLRCYPFVAPLPI